MLALFPAARAARRFYLMFQVRRLWFPDGRFVLVCGSARPGWDEFVREALLPEIGDNAVYEGHPVPNYAGTLAVRLASTFAGATDMTAAIVFKPNYEFELVDFTYALDTLEQTGIPLAKTAAYLAARVEKHREDIRVYI